MGIRMRGALPGSVWSLSMCIPSARTTTRCPAMAATRFTNGVAPPQWNPQPPSVSPLRFSMRSHVRIDSGAQNETMLAVVTAAKSLV